MGLAYFQMPPEALAALKPLIAQHESDILGPRARGYFFDRPDEYDYVSVQQVARSLYDLGVAGAQASLELSENEAHSLSMLDFELPGDDLEFPPAPFMASAAPEQVRRYLRFIQRKLGPTPEGAAARVEATSNDPRYTGYLKHQVRNLRVALPKVWRFFEAAERAGAGVLVVDLRARDVEIPEAVELAY